MILQFVIIDILWLDLCKMYVLEEYFFVQSSKNTHCTKQAVSLTLKKENNKD